MAKQKLVIGVDESGKGDFFGPLVTAAVCFSDADAERMNAQGIRDSKKIADNKLLLIDEYRRELFPHAIVVLLPEEYNTTYDKIKNLNKLLAACHADVICQIQNTTHATHAISDKFGKPELIEQELLNRNSSIHLTQLIQGEKIMQVAAASILARAGFLRAMKALSDNIGFTLPKGAGPPVDLAGKELADSHGMKIFSKVAKLHFKNLQKINTPQLF